MEGRIVVPAEHEAVEHHPVRHGRGSAETDLRG
jgi:hypothetical protein